MTNPIPFPIEYVTPRIGELSKRELIIEIMHHQEAALSTVSLNNLRGMVVKFRADVVHRALIEEAGLGEDDAEGQGQFL